MLGGGPYNTARTIGRLGGEVTFLGCISRDAFGERLVRGLQADGVDTRLVIEDRVANDPGPGGARRGGRCAISVLRGRDGGA